MNVVDSSGWLEYFADGSEPPDPQAWDRAAEAFQKDLAAVQELVADPASDLFKPFPHGQGQTLLREALLVADHNAYHLGEMVVVRRLLAPGNEAASVVRCSFTGGIVRNRPRFRDRQAVQ